MKTTRLNPISGARRSGGCPSQRLHLVIAGAGGNIGSHLVQLLARRADVARLTLVDFDRYETRNLSSQAIELADLGKPKSEVQARRARRINPELEVRSIVDRIENAPLGWLRGDVLFGCLDSKAGRRFANEIAWRLGMKFIDAGVEASVQLARVNSYIPAESQPCHACAWDARDYAALGTRHACDATDPKTPATNAPVYLGALAAAMQAIECDKLIALGEAATAGHQVLIEAATNHLYVTRFHRNPECRFDHTTWTITALRESPGELTIGDTFGLFRAAREQPASSLGFAGFALVEQLDCPGCGFSRRIFKLQERLRLRERVCPKCEHELLAAGFHVSTRLLRSELAPGAAARSLASLGLRAGDVISVRCGKKEKFFELGGGSCQEAGMGYSSRPTRDSRRRLLRSTVRKPNLAHPIQRRNL